MRIAGWVACAVVTLTIALPIGWSSVALASEPGNGSIHIRVAHTSIPGTADTEAHILDRILKAGSRERDCQDNATNCTLSSQIPTGVQSDGSGNEMLVKYEDLSYKVWSLKTGKVLLQIPATVNGYYATSSWMSNDGRYIATDINSLKATAGLVVWHLVASAAC